MSAGQNKKLNSPITVATLKAFTGFLWLVYTLLESASWTHPSSSHSFPDSPVLLSPWTLPLYRTWSYCPCFCPSRIHSLHWASTLVTNLAVTCLLGTFNLFPWLPSSLIPPLPPQTLLLGDIKLLYFSDYTHQSSCFSLASTISFPFKRPFPPSPPGWRLL